MEARIKQTPPTEEETLGYVTVEKLEDFLRRVHRDKLQYVTMELLVGSLFPILYKNFQKRLSDEHMRGYMDGLKEKDKTEINND